MISGCYRLPGDSSSHNVAERATVVQNSRLRFFGVEEGGFSGGYWLHDRMPLRRRDIYYFDRESDLLVLFSGYIYNRDELARSHGITAGDPEPAIAATLFRMHGPAFVSELNGDFAVFICHPSGGRAWLFRDHIGIRPLVWALHEGHLLFSSDVRRLSRFMAAGEGPDRSWLSGIFRYIDYTRAPCRKVERVPPGHWMEYDREGIRLRRYWDPALNKTDHSMQYETMIADLERLVSDAVTIRCDRRFTAGAHVSGGLDSGVVAALARREYPSQSTFHGYSWSPDGFNPKEVLPYDERDLVRGQCRASDITPVFATVTSAAFRENTGHLFSNGGFFVEESVVRQAATRGTNLIFSGWGGDEFISTGDRGVDLDLLRSLKLRLLFSRYTLRPVKIYLRAILRFMALPALGILYPSVARSFAEGTRYLRKPFRRSERKALRNFYFHTSRRQMHLRYFKFYHLQERCEIWTIMGYMSGVEYRYPLLDRRIVEYMIRVPSELLCKDGIFRPLLREIGRELLPEDVLRNNSKMDHLFAEWWYGVMKEAALSFVDEVEKWERNPDLAFVDFKRLKADIGAYRADSPEKENRNLIRALVNIRAVHEFTVDWYGDA